VSTRDPRSAHRDVARFDRWADGYDRSILQRLFFAPVHRAMGRALDPRNEDRILDVGCGTGILTATLAERSAEVVGVDPAPRMISKANGGRSGTGAWFLVASAESLPFPDASFDGATASLTVHHWEDAERGLIEIARVLRPGARLAIAEMDLPGPVRRFLRLLGSPHAGWSRYELAGLLYRSGFSRVRAIPRGPGLAVIVADR
jgi:ubiquinone/menaquinone biosynthesis C-methylase UbiE